MNLSSSSSSDEYSSSDEESVAVPKAISSSTETTIPLNESNQGTNVVADKDVATYDGKNDAEEDDCSVEWEDGDSLEEGGMDIVEASSPSSSQPTGLLYRSLPSREVIIDMSVDANDISNDNHETMKSGKKIIKAAKKRRKPKKVVKTSINVTPAIKDLALQIHRAHILTWISRSRQLSGVCSDPDLLHLAHSLLPIQFLSQPTASHSLLMQFQNWFTHELLAPHSSSSTIPYSRRRKRKRNTDISLFPQEGQGDTRKERFLQLFSHLSSIHSDDNIRNKKNDNYNDITPHEKTQLFVIFTRSIGWRSRYVIALEPISQYVTTSHPLWDFWKNMASLFQHGKIKEPKTQHSLSPTPATQKRKKLKNSRKNESDQTHDQNDIRGYLSWVEISVNGLNESYAVSGENEDWIHVDVERQLVNEPLLVESILASVHIGESRNKKYNFRRQKQPLSYAIAVENNEITDVTCRYSNSWSTTLKLRGTSDKDILSSYNNEETIKCIHSQWWSKTLHAIQNKTTNLPKSTYDDQKCVPEKKPSLKKKEQVKQQPLKESNTNYKLVMPKKTESSLAMKQAPEVNLANNCHDFVKQNKNRVDSANNGLKNEAFPTSKAAFKKHPIYVIPSILKKAEVLAPGSKSRVCGMFKGEFIYRRSDVSVAIGKKKWLYQGRKVKESEISNPVKTVKARKKPIKKGFQTIDYGIDLKDQADDPRLLSMKKSDGSHNDLEEDQLYGIWQTDAWSPPAVGPVDPIPVNEYKNVELELLNPGLVHLEMKQISVVARKLGIPYAPCLVGFEGHHGNRTPSIRGIVVHQHNEDLLKEAHAEWESQSIEKSVQDRQKELYRRWKRIIVGLLTKDRLEKEYAND